MRCGGASSVTTTSSAAWSTSLTGPRAPTGLSVGRLAGMRPVALQVLTSPARSWVVGGKGGGQKQRIWGSNCRYVFVIDTGAFHSLFFIPRYILLYIDFIELFQTNQAVRLLTVISAANYKNRDGKYLNWDTAPFPNKWPCALLFLLMGRVQNGAAFSYIRYMTSRQKNFKSEKTNIKIRPHNKDRKAGKATFRLNSELATGSWRFFHASQEILSLIVVCGYVVKRATKCTGTWGLQGLVEDWVGMG